MLSTLAMLNKWKCCISAQHILNKATGALMHMVLKRSAVTRQIKGGRGARPHKRWQPSVRAAARRKM
eukprot:6209047-Pleurochrysis_carterae.AAC.1